MLKILLDKIEKINEEFLSFNNNVNINSIQKLLNEINIEDNNTFILIKNIYNSKNDYELISNLKNIVKHFETFSFIKTFRNNNKKIALWTNNAEEGLYSNTEYANIANIESVSYMWDILELCVNKKKLLNTLNDNNCWSRFNNKIHIAHIATIVFIKMVPSKQLKNIKIFAIGKDETKIKIESSLAMFELPILYKRLKREQKYLLKEYDKIKLPFTSCKFNENYNEPIHFKPIVMTYKNFSQYNSSDLKKIVIEHMEKQKIFKKSCKKITKIKNINKYKIKSKKINTISI